MPENIVDQYNRTPLHYAATSGNKLCCEECLEFGFPVDGRDKFGQTPIMFAATNTDSKSINKEHSIPHAYNTVLYFTSIFSWNY